jgi:hypothetical protein
LEGKIRNREEQTWELEKKGRRGKEKGRKGQRKRENGK